MLDVKVSIYAWILGAGWHILIKQELVFIKRLRAVCSWLSGMPVVAYTHEILFD
jgi:hypothetical protein